jgi:hypothetical protein
MTTVQKRRGELCPPVPAVAAACRSFVSVKTIFAMLSTLLMIGTATGGGRGERQIITAPIVIQAGHTLTIQAGSELLFAPFTGVTVRRGGRLLAHGTKERPVTFSSANDTAGTGAAFDWNGIKIEGGGGAVLSYCLIANASAGVTAADSGGVTLSQCIFANNGQWDLSVAEEPQLFPKDMRPRDYMPARPEAAPPELVIPPIDVKAAPDAAPQIAKPSRKQWAGWVMGGAGAAAAVAGVAFLLQASNIAGEHDAYEPEIDKNSPIAPPQTPSLDQQHLDALQKKRDAARTIGLTFLGLAVVDGICLIFIF